MGASTISIATSNPGRTIALEALRLQPSARVKVRAKDLEAASIFAVPANLFIAPSTLVEADCEKPRFMPNARQATHSPKKTGAVSDSRILPSHRFQKRSEAGQVANVGRLVTLAP